MTFSIRPQRKRMSGVPMEMSLPDSGATETLGRSLAATLPRSATTGAVLYLQGELGTGKTTTARSLLQALGVIGKVRSPTYALIDTYVLPGLACVHIDLYRVQSRSEVEELGIRDLSGPGSLMLIEWPEKGAGAIPPADLLLALDYAGEARQASVRAESQFGNDWLSKLLQDRSLSPYVSNIT
jgi:tRNA threonylcarbamoyladenosine biosynthesis protein TsaE